jgi:hypothetical protein
MIFGFSYCNPPHKCTLRCGDSFCIACITSHFADVADQCPLCFDELGRQ